MSAQETFPGRVRVPDAASIPEGGLRAVDTPGGRVCVARIGGVLHALADACPHAGGPLSEGRVEDGLIRCPWHDRHFDPRTGACVDRPGSTPPAKTYEVEPG